MPFSPSTLKSWEFISFILVTAGVWAGQLAGSVSAQTAVVLTAAAAAATALGRGLAKQNSDPKPFYGTTEFYVALVGAAQAGVAKLNGSISAHTLAEITVSLTAAMTIAEGIGTIPPPPVSMTPPNDGNDTLVAPKAT